MIEPSGVAPLGDGRRVLVADDKAAVLHVVDVATGAIVGAPLGSSKLPPTTKTGPRWEGMALDSEGNYYLVGSHSGKSDEERAASSVVVRFRLRDGDAPAIDDASVVRWSIARALEAALRRRGSMRRGSRNGRSRGWRFARAGADASWSSDSASRTTRSAPSPPTSPPRRRPDATLSLRPLFAFDAGRREGITPQLTSLEYVPVMGGFLVLTAALGTDNAVRDNTLWLVNNGQPHVVRSYATFEVAMKAGGLAVLDVKATGHRTEIKLLITYDNDPHATRLPSRFQTAMLVHDRS